jgi:hypothetical protein
MTTSRKVLIIRDASLFTTGLTAWLTCETTCQVSTICLDDGTLWQRAIIRTRPDVIVLSCAVLIEPAPARSRYNLTRIDHDPGGCGPPR